MGTPYLLQARAILRSWNVVRPHLEAVVVDFHQLVVLPKQGDDLVYIVGELGVAAVANHMDAGVLGHLAPQVGALLHVGVLQPLQGQVVDRGHHPVQRPGVAGSKSRRPSKSSTLASMPAR